MAANQGRGVVLAAAAHPDDIEFMMAGTMALLGDAGWELHYLNIASGSCGTAVHSRDEIVEIRTAEAREAAESIGATFHPPLVDDLEILYDLGLVRRLTAVVRQIQPTILLLQSPQDYMEDHMNAARLMVTAAFCRAMVNFWSEPETPTTQQDMALYHALPYGLRDQLGAPVKAEFYVDVTSVMERKRAMLACHRSQKEWLDHSQGLDSYLITMENMCREVGRNFSLSRSGEGWRRHSHLGFGPPDFDPLADTLGRLAHRNLSY
ncbi:MAG: LmbE family protein [candidate division WS1 bacterium]|jgi:LmbE family N-acetylglucosaminyl deacetylase|nr:LmbE family protein [candidate division WS1 bacterium]